jgi:hypothetical protein
MIRLLILSISLATYSGIKGQIADHRFAPIQELFIANTKYRSSVNSACDTFRYADRIDERVIDVLKEIIAADTVIKGPTYGGIIKDSLTITGGERQMIIEKLTMAGNHRWESNLFPKSQLVKAELADTIVKRVSKTKDSLMVKLCTEIYSFSKPFFFRNDTLCVFYFEKNSVLMREGECWLYKKEKNEWRKYFKIFHWFD